MYLCVEESGINTSVVESGINTKNLTPGDLLVAMASSCDLKNHKLFTVGLHFPITLISTEHAQCWEFAVLAEVDNWFAEPTDDWLTNGSGVVC